MSDDWEEECGGSSFDSKPSNDEGFGFGKSSDTNGFDDNSSGGFGGGGFGGRRGGGRGSRGGFGQDDNGFDNNSGGGFGAGRGKRGGFGDRSDQNGFGDSDGGRGFRGSRGRGRGGGFGRQDGDSEENGFDNDGGFGGQRGGGQGHGRGGGVSGGMDGDDAGGQGGGFRRRRGSDRDGDGDGGDSFGGGEGGEEKPQRVMYIPPAPPEEEEEIFKTIQKGINFDNYDNIAVEVTGRDPVQPITSFQEAALYDTFKSNVEKAKYVKPTPVQKYSIPAILAGRDLMACAQTGSGKTAAFVLPVMTGMIDNGLTGSQMSEIQAPQALVIAPTRELANQIYYEARKFAYGTMLKACVCYGGVSVGHQLSQIERGCHLLVATPGRLMDFINRRKISLHALKYLVLDEADRMLDMGFEPKIRELAENQDFPPKTERQTLMFSATFPEEIQKLAGEFLNDYLFLTVGRVGSATSDIEQNICQVSEFEKRDKLVELLNNAGSDRMLVFVETKRMADFLASYLSQTGFPTTSIHGDRQQEEREEALRDFKKGRTPVMVATSVAARGLDIPDVKHVINYDLPKEIEEYVHRIGRTGRIGNKGKATSFFQSDKDGNIARSLVKVLGDAEQEVPDWLEEQAENAIGTNYGPAGGRFGGRDTRKFEKGNSGGNNDFGGNGDDSWGVDDSSNNAGGGGDDWNTNSVNTGGDESWD